MKLIDCFMYFDEDLVLDIRLNILNDKVDKFIIVEATKNHAGKDKKLNFNIENFSKFKNKIIYIVVDDMPINVKSPKKGWHENHVRDQFQRNAIKRGYKDFSDDDLIMISDIDEIPNPKKLDEFNVKNKFACFLQKNFQSKINLLNVSDGEWSGTKICQKKYLKSPQWLRDIKGRSYPFWRLDILFSKMKYNSIEYVENGGWHFTNLRTAEELKKKLENFGHNAEFLESGLNVNDITKMMENNLAVYDYEADMKGNKWSGKPLIKTETKELPQYILLNKEKYTDWFS